MNIYSQGKNIKIVLFPFHLSKVVMIDQQLHIFLQKKFACVSKGKQISKLKLVLQDQCTSNATMYYTINQLHVSACNKSIST